MKHLLTRADDRLRALLLKEQDALVLTSSAVVLWLAFACVLWRMPLAQLDGAGFMQRLVAVFLLSVPLMVMFGFALCAGTGKSMLHCLCLLSVCVAGMLLRLCFLDHVSSDFEIYLSDWLQRLGSGSFSAGMRERIGDYNVLYQYLLFLVSQLDVPPLYGVKLMSFFGDVLLAGAAAYLAGDGKRLDPLALCAVLLLPTCALDSGMFAQCDSLYAACALWGLALALRGRPAQAAVCFALSLAFKLQAVFLLPIVAVLWADRRLRVADAGVFLLTLAAVMLPAVLGGKSPARIIGIYMAQTGLYTGLNYGAANLFGLMPTQGLDVYAYGGFAMALALGACVLLVGAGMRRAGHMTGDDYVHLALLLVLLIVFLLPRMHERYFYLAGALSVALACRLPRMIPAAALIELASLSTYWALELTLAAASGMMLAAIVLVLASFAGWGRNLLSEGKA